MNTEVIIDCTKLEVHQVKDLFFFIIHKKDPLSTPALKLKVKQNRQRMLFSLFGVRPLSQYGNLYSLTTLTKVKP